jgi:hypothetical protein
MKILTAAAIILSSLSIPARAYHLPLACSADPGCSHAALCFGCIKSPEGFECSRDLYEQRNIAETERLKCQGVKK